MKEGDDRGLKLQQWLHEDVHHPYRWPCATRAFSSPAGSPQGSRATAAFSLPARAWERAAKGGLSSAVRGASAACSEGVRHGHRTPGRPSAALAHPLGSAGPWCPHGLGMGLCRAGGAGGCVPRLARRPSHAGSAAAVTESSGYPCLIHSHDTPHQGKLWSSGSYQDI